LGVQKTNNEPLTQRIAHGALNNWGQYVFKYMRDSETNLQSQQIWLSLCVNCSLLILGLVIFITMKDTYKDNKTTANNT